LSFVADILVFFQFRGLGAIFSKNGQIFANLLVTLVISGLCYKNILIITSDACTINVLA
jgi:hypothetical protein